VDQLLEEADCDGIPAFRFPGPSHLDSLGLSGPILAYEFDFFGQDGFKEVLTDPAMVDLGPEFPSGSLRGRQIVHDADEDLLATTIFKHGREGNAAIS